MSELGTDDPFGDMSQWSDSLADQWVSLLNQRASAIDQARLRSSLLGFARVGEGANVLEVGCGTGPLLVDLARTVGPSGRVLGIDPQPRFVQAARQRLKREGASSVAEARVGSIEVIDCPADSFDICIAQTVLIHLDPETLHQGLSEIRRVVIDDGWFVTVDQDGDTWTLDHPDRATTRKIVQFSSDQRYADGWTGRRLHRILVDAEFRNVDVEAAVHTDTAAADSYLFGMALRVSDAAAKLGVITEEDALKWQDQLSENAARGRFFSSINYYLGRGQF